MYSLKHLIIFAFSNNKFIAKHLQKINEIYVNMKISEM
jgi:hypothetical protein